MIELQSLSELSMHHLALGFMKLKKENKRLQDVKKKDTCNNQGDNNIT